MFLDLTLKYVYNCQLIGWTLLLHQSEESDSSEKEFVVAIWRERDLIFIYIISSCLNEEFWDNIFE